MDRILILDFGSQYTQLIARRIREQNVYCEIWPYHVFLEKVQKFHPKGLIFSGGPASVLDKNAHFIDPEIYTLDIPILGICYGMQLITHQWKGRVEKAAHREYGASAVTLLEDSLLFSGFKKEKKYKVWMSHGDRILKHPKDFKVVGRSQNAPIAAIEHYTKPIYAVQFHPEVTHTSEGTEILKNFIFKICKVKPTWTLQSFIENTVHEVQKRVGKDRVVMGVSGGVDSTVAAFLLQKAIGDQLIPIFINNGLLRLNEEKKVMDLFQTTRHMKLHYVDASQRFLNALEGVTDPEQKRKIIGHEFIKVFEEEAQKIKNAKFLGQGTLYPDVIESVSFHGGPTKTIKSHHNVGGLPKDMNLKLIEPLKELFKDEVRNLGKMLGIPDEFINRQPFPGPGLAVRILGEVTSRALKLLRLADDIVVSEIKKANTYNKVWQSFAVLLPVKSVGVMGDERTYENVCAIRCVKSQDGMTADWVDLSHELLARMSNRIINEVKGVNRVVYDVSSKPPATIEWE